MKQLLEYGITTSQADVWAHVCPLDGDIYYYSRKRMLKLIDKCKKVSIPTAEGRIVPIIKNEKARGGIIHVIDVPWQWWEYEKLSAKDEIPNDRIAGQRAESLFNRCVIDGLFTIPCAASFYTEQSDQFRGIDFKVFPKASSIDVEVKFDGAGGLYGSGNLFVQTNEKDHKPLERNAHYDQA